MLDYPPNGPNVIIRVLKGEKREEKVREDVTAKAKAVAMQGHEPRTVGAVKVENTGKQILF